MSMAAATDEVSSIKGSEEPYFKQFQKLKKGHKTRDPKNADVWGDYKQLILFPNHLPDLYLPTRESFQETLSDDDSLRSHHRVIGSFFSTKLVRYPTYAVTIFLTIYLFSGMIQYVDDRMFSLDFLMTRIEWLLIWSNSISAKLGYLVLLPFWLALCWLSKQVFDYENKFKKWHQGDMPDWKEKNKNGVLGNWIKGYTNHLIEEEINPEFSLAMDKLIHILSMTNNYTDLKSGKKNSYLPQWEDHIGRMQASKCRIEYREELKQLLKSVSDLIILLSPEDRTAYKRFNDQDESIDNETITTSSQSYMATLQEELHRRTRYVSNVEVQKRWKGLLDKPDFAARILSGESGNEIGFHSLMETMKSQTRKEAHLIQAKSGHGKSTLVLQFAIACLENEKLGLAPLIIKARELGEVATDGNLNIDALGLPSAYILHWKDSKQRVLIIDGLDENILHKNSLNLHLRKAMTLYDAHLIVTSRPIVHRKTEYTTWELSGITEEYQGRLIMASSDDPDCRKRLANSLSKSLKQKPLVIFGSSEILSQNRDDFQNADLSTHALAKWMAQHVHEQSRQKYGHTDVENEQIISAAGIHSAEKIVKTKRYDRQAAGMPGHNIARQWQLINENGILELFLEGFYITQAIEEDRTGLLEEVVDILDANEDDEECDEEYDEERLESFVRHYLTSPNEQIKPLIKHAELRDWKIEYFLKFGQQEWVRGNNLTKTRILQRLGLPSDKNGRLKVEALADIDKIYRKPVFYHALLSFHCTTWEQHVDTWANHEDTTWLFLTKLIMEHHCEFAIQSARRYLPLLRLNKISSIRWKLIKEEDLPPPRKISILHFLTEIPPNTDTWKSATRRKITTTYAEAVAWRTSNETDSSDYREFTTPLRDNLNLLNQRYYGALADMISASSSRFVPLKRTNIWEYDGYTTMPKPLLNLLEDIFGLLKSDGEQAFCHALHRFYAFLLITRWSEEAAVFGLNYDQDLHSRFLAQMNQLESNSSAHLSLRKIYVVLRGGDFKSSNPLKLDGEILNLQRKEIIDSSKVCESNEPILDLEQMKIVSLRSLKNKSVLVGNDSSKKTLPRYTNKLKQSELVSWDYMNRKDSEGDRMQLGGMNKDGINFKRFVFWEYIHSPIPLYLLPDYWPCFVGIDPMAIVSSEVPWAQMMGFTDLPEKRKALLSDSTESRKYTRLNHLFREIKKFGTVTNSHQVASLHPDYEEIMAEKYYLIFNTRKGPNIKGRFYFSLMNRPVGGDIYVTDEIQPLFEKLQSLYIDYKGKKSFSFEVKFGIHKSNRNGHLLLYPAELVHVCKHCLRRLDQSNLREICTNCKSELIGEANSGILGHLHAILPMVENLTFDLAKRLISWNDTLHDTGGQANKVRSVLSFYHPNIPAKDWNVNP